MIASPFFWVPDGPVGIESKATNRCSWSQAICPCPAPRLGAWRIGKRSGGCWFYGGRDEFRHQQQMKQQSIILKHHWHFMKSQESSKKSPWRSHELTILLKPWDLRCSKRGLFDRGEDSTIPPPWEMARKRPNLSSTGEPWRVAAEFPGDFHHEKIGNITW